MNTVVLNLEDDLMALLSRPPQPIEQTARELIVFELYRRNAISSGKGAELLAISPSDFLRRASEVGIVYFNMTPDQLEAERLESEAL